MATKDQVVIIHVLKSKAKMSDEDYRSLLSGYQARSSKDLDVEQAADLVERLKRLAPEQEQAPGPKRFDNIGKRHGWATPKQLRMIEAMWMDVSRAGDREAKVKAFGTFLGNRFGISRMEWVPVELVGKVVKTLCAMKAQQQKESLNAGTSKQV